MALPDMYSMIEFPVNNQHGEAMKKIVMAASFVLCLGLGLPAYSEDGATLYMTRGCIGCHGAGGNAPVAPNYPKIGMQNKEYTINQLKAFKDKTRSNGLAVMMAGMVAALTDEDMENLAEYLATGGN